MDEVLLGKAAISERCLVRIHEEYDSHEGELETNFTRQDALLLNIQRACEAAIDGAMHLVRIHRLQWTLSVERLNTRVERGRPAREFARHLPQAGGTPALPGWQPFAAFSCNSNRRWSAESHPRVCADKKQGEVTS